MEMEGLVQTGEQLIRLGRFEESILVLRQVLVEDPTNLPALLTIGIAFTEAGRNDEAIQALGFYLSHHAATDEACEALGCAYLRKGEHGPAEKQLRLALRINPQNASVMRNLSVLLTRTDRGAEAFALLQRSYELNPTDFMTLYALAGAHLFLGHREQAQQFFHELLALENVPPTLYAEAAGRYSALLVGW